MAKGAYLANAHLGGLPCYADGRIAQDKTLHTIKHALNLCNVVPYRYKVVNQFESRFSKKYFFETRN